MWHKLLGWWDELPGPSRQGDRGERLAAQWLGRELGFSVVARNWRNPRDRREEIDLVCRDGEVLVFVEVKTRAPDALVPGFFAVDRRKKRVLLRAIRAYLERMNPRPWTFRFDVVEVVMRPTREVGKFGAASSIRVTHYEAVSLFPKHFR